MLTIEGNLVNLDKTVRGRIEIGNDGLISNVSGPNGQADLVFGQELVFPGFVDIHVHARECADHSWDYKEDFMTAGQAALNGGVVAFADMPNNPVPPVDEKSYAEKLRLAEKSAVDVLLYAGIGPKTSPLGEKVPYKVFMGKSVGELYFSSMGDLDAALSKFSGQSVSFHCEDPEILEADKNQPTHALRRPPEAELSAIDFALGFIKKYNLIGKICHCSTAEGMEKIAAAKQAGLSVTVEVTPAHLFFDNETSAADKNPFLQINPPVRQTQKNRLALIAALKKGDIDYLATDHAPHTIGEKENGMSGIPQLDTFGSFASWLMAEHGFTAQEIARVCAYNPGKFMNNFMPIKFGEIKTGFAGCLTVLNMDRPVIISKTTLKTKCGWSPFEGFEFSGSVAATIIRGKVYRRETIKVPRSRAGEVLTAR
ncbi:MAG: amidohydrolase family protein [Candidatus Doudnabacteria bacterium]|nr:amidohydrolase family protein [Candidatus Doudnabacteria bacterium]